MKEVEKKEESKAREKKNEKTQEKKTHQAVLAATSHEAVVQPAERGMYDVSRLGMSVVSIVNSP